MFARCLQRSILALFLTGVIVCAFGRFDAQTGSSQYRFDSYTTDDGLPQNGVRGIAQTPDGYLWFTTFDGLVRFDGLKFTVFDKNNTDGIGSNRFATLHLMDDGTLLAGTEDGGLTVYSGGKFRTFTTADGLPSNSIATFKTDIRGEVFVETSKGNVYYRNGSIVAANDVGLPENNFRYIGPKTSNWIYDRDHFVQITADGRRTSYPIKLEYYTETLTGVTGFEDSKGVFWVGDLSGVYSIRDGVITHLTEKAGVPRGAVLRPYTEDNEGGIWFSTGWGNTARVGAVRYFEGKFTVIDEGSGLSDLGITQIFKDREGTLWIASDKGINHLRKQLFTTYSEKDGLVDNEVYPILQASNGDIYVGTTRGLSVFRDGRFSELKLRDPNGDPFFITSLFEDAKQRLWIGTTGDLCILENGVLRKVAGFSRNSIWAIKGDRQGSIWVGTSAGLFELRDDVVSASYTIANGLPNDDVKVIHEDRNGAMWFGTYGGLAKYENGKFAIYTQDAGLVSDRVRSIYEDASGTLWIGTYDGGMSRFRDGRFFNYSTNNGLFNNGVFQVLEDSNENLWISCNRGIYNVDRKSLDAFADGTASAVNYVAYGKADGIANPEANGGRQPAGIKAADGRFWFPTQEGVAVVDPANVERNPQPPAVRIESLNVEFQSQDLTKEITLRADRDDLQVNFTGITFIKPEQVRFRYRIEGLDENWNDAGTRRDVNYAFLPAGEYVFRVVAGNSDGVWNEVGDSIKISVIAPFWRRSWFIALTVALLALVVFVLYKRRIAALQRINLAKETFARQLIESQENERRRIAAELHDSLGQSLVLIKNWALLGLKSDKEKKPTAANLNEISETASEAINEVREIAYNLGPYQLERLGLRSTIVEMIEKVSASSTIEFDLNIDEITEKLNKEQEVNIFRIVQETVNNVIKHAEATRVSISLTAEAGKVFYNISDNGKGLAPNAQSDSKGFGMLGIAERVSLLKGAIAVSSDPGKGTSINVTIPC